jgi:type IV secretory pathway VirJ component
MRRRTLSGRLALTASLLIVVLLGLMQGPALARPVRRRAAALTPEARRVAALPLVEVPARPGAAERDEMAVLLTGDGGWAETDRGLSAALARGGIPVVGWNSLRYFLTGKKPERAARDLELVLRHYLPRWHKEKVILIGYSFGADVVPFLANRLPPDLAERISLIAILGPSGRADFRFHVTELLGRDSKDSVPTLPELERLRGTPLLCVQGVAEKNSFCPRLPDGLAYVLIRPGTHIIGKNYGPIAEWILGPRRFRHP